MRYKHLIFLLFISLGSSIFAQLSKTHYIPPLTSSDGFTDQYIYISTPKSGVNFTIKRAGSSTIPSSYSGTVSNGSPLEIAVLDDNGFTNQRDSHLQYELNQITWELPNTPITNKGFIIEATDVIFVSIRVRSTDGNQLGPFHAGALVSKGLAALGKSFRVGGFERTAVTDNDNDVLFASVMATENQTKVEIKEVPTSLKFLDGNTGPFNVDLNEGESYIIAVRGTGNTKELLGGLIESNKNIVVNSGSAYGSFGTTQGNADYGFDQIVGDDKIGKEYILVKGPGLNVVENILVVAHKNNTQLFVNNAPYKSPLSKGEYYVIEGNEYNPQGLIYLNSTEDVFVYQGIGGANQANQGLFFVPPLGCESTDDVDEIPFIDKIDDATFIGGATVISNKGANVQVDGVDINTYSKVVGKEEITTNLGDYIVYKLSNLTGNVSFTSDKELYCNYYNSVSASTTGAYYSGFPIPPTINFDVSSAGCISSSGSPAVLTATNVDTFDSYEWQYLFDEGVITDPTDDDWRRVGSINSTNFNATQIGQFRLVGTTCSGDQYISPIIPVSQCASDIDNDGVIDNLDVDMDNDGILNCDESSGGLTFNLSNPNSPSLSFNNTGNPLNSFVTGAVSSDIATNSFIGDLSGNFTSSLTTTSASSNRYNLNFNGNVNLKMTPDNLSASTDDDFFILRIGPNTKNISIINNDDQLLIDSDFDGVYESGVQRLDAYEIRFKINTSVSSGTFEIVAKEVESLIFEHYRLNGSPSPSSFSGKIELTCFAKDSDGDGIEDALDLDSDNDGIPDLYENATKDITLLLVDSDNDGLDDIFGPNLTLTVTDTDNDGIPNYRDLDSDNDGIYDAIESGFNLNHTNGMITGVNPSDFGNNGLLNSLETSIDSGILNDLPLNSDANSDDVNLRDEIFNFADLDSDGDDCFDVLEAGFIGSLSNGMLLPDPTDVNGFGIVQNSNGYTTPNLDYLTSAPIIINSFTDTTFCEDETNVINIDSNLDLSLGDTWQWEVSTDNGTTWADISNITPYSDSTTNNLTITKTPASFDGNLYRVKLGRAGRSCDPVTSNPITLTVNPKPKVNNASIIQCISANNTNPTVNLTIAQNDISSATNVTFKFYTDNGATNEILTPNSYPVTPNVFPPQSVWVTVTDNVTSCVSDVVELVLNVNTYIDNNPDTTGITTAFSDDSVNPSTGNVETGMGFDTDRTTFFVLDKTAIEKLLPTIPNTNIFYFENITDRANSVDDIDITGFRNNISKNDVTVFNGYIQFPIYYKIVSKADPNCKGLGEFNVQIYDTPNANSVSDIEECDDAASGRTDDGENSNINLRDKEPDILGTQDPNIFKVTFHKTPGDAFNDTSKIIDPVNYRNDANFIGGGVSEQIIYVRVENIVTGTFNANTSFKIIIQPIPTLSTTITNLPICDVDSDPRNRLAQKIDLTVKDAEILSGSLSSGYIVEYYNLQGDAEKRINRILDPTNFENDQNLTSFPSTAISDDPGIQTIFFVVVDKNGLQCPSVVYSFDLEVYPEPYIAPTITTYSDCDNDDDGDDTNGQIQGIDLNGKIPEILGIPNIFGTTRNANDYEVTFHTSSADLASGANPLPSPYDNQISDETILIRVENKLTGCVNSNRSFKIIINELPSFTVTTPQILCLNDLPFNIAVENPDDVYSYQWYDPSGNEITGATDDNLDINVAGTYRVKAIDNTTFCERIEEIIINESNRATLDPSFVTIVDESNNLGASNKLSISIDTINNDLGPGDYQFAILNTETNTRIPFIGFQDDPLFEGIEGGIYQIIVNDKNGCVPDATLEVSVLQFPKFFTPNGDSQNDFWVIKGANKTFYPNSSINIFNRYGKLVAQMEVGDQGWDGTFNGRLLPSDDYWYHVILVPSDPDKPRVDRKGNFSLLRR